jgi:hypothetical protein
VVVLGQLPLHLPTNFIVEPQIQIAADRHCSQEAEEQAPCKKRPTEVDQTCENRRGP